MKENHTTHKHHFKVPNIRFRERMLLIYLIGGIIPFILVSYFTNWSVRNQVAGQNKEAQSEEISLIVVTLVNRLWSQKKFPSIFVMTKN